MRAFRYFYAAARILFPVFIAVALPFALSASVVGGVNVAIFAAAGRANGLVLAVRRTAAMRGSVCFYLTAGIHLPVFSTVALPFAQSAAVVGGIECTVFFAAVGDLKRGLNCNTQRLPCRMRFLSLP